MNRHEDLIDDAVRSYRRLLYLYPAGFRRRFGEPMADLFQAQLESRVAKRGLVGLIAAWSVVLRELPHTLWREHRTVLEQRNPGVSWRRLSVAALLPLGGALAWRWAGFEPPAAGFVALWLACCVFPALSRWGRGWSSVVAAARGGASAISLAILWGALSEGPGIALGPALVMIGCAATAGLIVGVLVRALVEGLALRPAAAPF
jgi:hypothetical protein